MDFNIHYHEGSDVTYPAKREGDLWDYGVLDVSANHDYCWMWKAAPERGARLSVTLRKAGE